MSIQIDGNTIKVEGAVLDLKGDITVSGTTHMDGATTLGGKTPVLLSPSSPQTGNITVTGTVTAGGVVLSGGPQEVSSVLTSPVAIPASLTEYTVLQVALLPGRWLLTASILVQSGNNPGIGWTVKVWDGASTVYAGANQSSQSAERAQITPPTVVVQVTEPTTVSLSVSATIDDDTNILTGTNWSDFAVLAASYNDAAVGGVTRILALRLGY